MSAHRFHPTILRAYDIRGIFEDTLTTGDAFAIGLSFISIQKQRGLGNEVTVGRDGRLSSPATSPSISAAVRRRCCISLPTSLAVVAPFR